MFSVSQLVKFSIYVTTGLIYIYRAPVLVVENFSSFVFSGILFTNFLPVKYGFPLQSVSGVSTYGRSHFLSKFM